MPEPTLLGDVIQPAWQSLTAEQRTCWHFFALQHPQLVEDGRLFTLWGMQLHYALNANIAVTETNPLLDDPPATTDKAEPVTFTAYAWPLQSRMADLSTSRNGFLYLEGNKPVPITVAAIVHQAYLRKKGGPGRPPRLRHATVAQPGSTGVLSLSTPEGYFATTAGDNRYSRIKGRTARRRGDLPLARVKTINLENGQITRGVIANPFGGSRTKTNRARATQIDPTNGVNHYP